ncbi:MAG: hypothetical protein R2781_03785 [Flavobacteriaceae bacterium]
MKKRNFLIAFLVIVAGAYTGYKYLYKSHRNIEAEVALLKVEAKQLVAMLLSDNSQGILNKTVEVTGIITEIENQSITLDEAIQCTFSQLPKGLELNKKVTIKGRCIGYDDLFELAKLDQCSLTNYL